MGLLSFLFGKKTDKVGDFVSRGAILLDVRTDKEYQSGHIKDATHIPIQDLKARISEVKALNKPVIAYCASGIRSEKARQLLNANGIDSINGGGIKSLMKALEQ